MEIKVWLDGLDKAKALLDPAQVSGPHLRTLLEAEGSYLLRSLDKTFLAEGRPAKWKPLKCRVGQILRDTGSLHKSFTVRGTSGNIFELGSSMVVVGSYDKRAPVHHYGATIRAKNKPYLVFKCGSKWIRARKVTIPARPMAVLQDEDIPTIARIAEDWLVRQFRGSR